MDFEKLYSLSNSVCTWNGFVFEHSIAIAKISCTLSGNCNTQTEKNYLLRYYKNEFYYLKKYIDDLILKCKELEKFYNENNIEGV